MRLNKNLFAVSTAFLGLLCGPALHAATITPNILTDPALVGPNTGTDCSLRYAIESINDGANFEGGCGAVSTGVLGTDDTVVLGAETYALTLAGNEDNNATGDIDIFQPVTIMGAGMDQTTIDASGIAGGDRALHFEDAGDSVVSGLTVTGGDTIGVGQAGGGIFAVELGLTLQGVRLFDNQAEAGGGLYYEGQGAGSLIIEGSEIDGNDALFCGGGIYLENSVAGISYSTISRNEVDSGDGGGEGGGICDFGTYLFLTNTTVSTNTAVDEGGGIWSSGGLKGAYNVTIAFNQVTGVGGIGGGMVNYNVSQNDDRFDPEIFNTIVAQNTADEGPDCWGSFLSGGFNFIGDIGTDVCTDFVDGVNGDQVGSPAAPIPPLIGPLANNGGPTETHALLVGSPAIDQGNPAGCEALDVPNFFENDMVVFNELTDDQRGLTRPVPILDPDVPICDIGAYEFQIPEPTPTPTPTATATPVPPPFNALLEGSGCALIGIGSASAAGGGSFALLSLLAGMAHWRLRRRLR